MSESTLTSSGLRSSSSEIEGIERSWRRGITPPSALTVVDWAEQNRRLSRESSLGGRYRVSRVEVSRGPMLAVTEPGVAKITVMAGTQIAKSTIIENVIGYFVDVDPCPMLVIQPKDDAAETFSKDRLAPMIRDTPALKEIFGDAKSRDSGSTLTHKQFPGGHITLVGANSPTNLAMRPIRIVLADEIDKYPLSAGSEGSPVTLAEERQSEFSANKLTVVACSPTIAGRSAIEASYEESDQRRPFVACPHCSEMQEILWHRVRWQKDTAGNILPATAGYFCEDCGTEWSEAGRFKALRRIEWRQTRPFTCCEVQQNAERWDGEGRALCRECGRRAISNEHAGFVISRLYSPKQSLRGMVEKFARALRRGPEELKAFFNTQLAQTWKEAGEAPEWEAVYNRRDDYRAGEVPAGALILFAGVDVQKDRLEVGVWGFGRNRQRWLVEHRVLPGPTNRPEVWRSLEALFDETWTHEGGGEMSVRDWGIDSGAFTAEVYAFVRSQQGRGNIHAVDGLDNYSAAYLGPGNKDTTENGKKIRRGIKTVRVGSSFCKQELLGQLALPRPENGGLYPPGFVHLPGDVPDEVVKQITSEELRTRVVRGRTRREWGTLAGRRNEALDCMNYARGLAAMRGWDRWNEARFAALEEQVRLMPAADDAPTVAMTPPAVRRSGWLGVDKGWLR